MKIKHISAVIPAFVVALLLGSCSGDDRDRVYYPYSTPSVTGLTVEPADIVYANDSLYYSLNVDDENTPLSTLEVSFNSPHVNYSETLRTKGNRFSVNHRGIFIPLNIGLEDGEKGVFRVHAVNVEGGDSTMEKAVIVRRPSLGSTLYFVISDGSTVQLHQSAINPYEYLSAPSYFNSNLKGKVQDTPTFDSSHIVWGGGETGNQATVVTRADDPDLTFSYPNTVVTTIRFNVLTFVMEAEGTSDAYVVNGTQLKPDGDYLSADIDFKQGQKVSFIGFSDLRHAYNRDFFSYDASTGECTFLRASGKWHVSYYKPFNYIWISREKDVAPDCFWMIGHGFTCAPVWDSYYENADGWNMEDIKQEAYVVKTGSGTYQCTVYLNNKHKWDSFEAEFYSDKAWGKGKGMLIYNENLSGDKAGIVSSKSNGITSSAGFTPGYYRLTFDTSAGVGKEKMNIKKIDE